MGAGSWETGFDTSGIIDWDSGTGEEDRRRLEDPDGLASGLVLCEPDGLELAGGSDVLGIGDSSSSEGDTELEEALAGTLIDG